MLQLTQLMAAEPVSDAGKAAQTALFARLVESLPQALTQEGSGILPAVTDVLAAIQKMVANSHKVHQDLFRWRHMLEPKTYPLPKDLNRNAALVCLNAIKSAQIGVRQAVVCVYILSTRSKVFRSNCLSL